MGNLFLLRALLTGSQSGSSHLQGFFGNVYTNPKFFRTSCDTWTSLLSMVWETDLFLYTWGPAYYRDRSLTETHSEPSVSHLSCNRNRDSSIEIGPWQKPTLSPQSVICPVTETETPSGKSSCPVTETKRPPYSPLDPYLEWTQPYILCRDNGDRKQ